MTEESLYGCYQWQSSHLFRGLFRILPETGLSSSSRHLALAASNVHERQEIDDRSHCGQAYPADDELPEIVGNHVVSRLAELEEVRTKDRL